MSTRSGLRTLVRLAPEMDTTTISDADLNTLLDKASIDVAVKGRALPRSEKFNAVAAQAQYVLSGVSPVLTGNDFVEIDLIGGGVLFDDGSRFIGSAKEGHGDGEFEPKTKEWLDSHEPGWRDADSASVPRYWFIDTQEDNSSNLVLGLFPKPSAAGTDTILLHYLSRGKLMTDDTHFPWTGSTTQLVHLESYEMLMVYWCWEFITRNIIKQTNDADRFLKTYLEGVFAMANRPPFTPFSREGMRAVSPFQGRGY